MLVSVSIPRRLVREIEAGAALAGVSRKQFLEHTLQNVFGK
jgi:hypothetical protein